LGSVTAMGESQAAVEAIHDALNAQLARMRQELARIPEQDHLNSEAAAEVHRLMQATVWEALHKLAQDLDALRSQV
jgi:hypothetical protein